MDDRARSAANHTPPEYHDVDSSKGRRPSRPLIQTGFSTGIAIQLQLTPPETPIGLHERAESQPAQALFHNYLRAFYPFDPAASLSDGDEASLMAASIKPGDLILVHSVHANGWADGTVLTSGERGWLPTNYCESFDHPYLRNLLNAMTQFWDLLGANEDANLSTFVRQDYIRGLVAGVRYLLEHADCLHRDAPMVQQHTGIRRMRKGLLADLSGLVQIAKSLQETISEPFAGEVIHYLLDDLIAKAFKVLTRAVGFVDIWTNEKAAKKLEITTQPVCHHPITPMLRTEELAMDTGAPLRAGLGHSVESAKTSPAVAERQNDDASAGAEAKDESIQTSERPLSVTFKSSKGLLTHRLSLVEADHTPFSALASEQLAKVHDSCISHIGAFIGHHLHSRSCSELVEATEKLVKACKDMLSVIEEVHSHDNDSQRSVPVQQARIALQLKLEELIKVTKDVFNFSDNDDGEVVIMPDQSTRLVSVATSLIRTAGECIAKTRSLVEQIGDFDLGAPPIPAAKAERVDIDCRESPVRVEEAQTQAQPRVMTSFEGRLSQKMLPPRPPFRQLALTATDTFDFALQSPATASNASSPMTPTSAGLHKSLPPAPMQRRSAVRLSQATTISGTTLKSLRSSRVDTGSPARKDSVGMSIAGSTDTLHSTAGDSGITTISEASTRATTPEQTKDPSSPDPGPLNSFTSMSSIRSAAIDAEIEAEARFLQKTYASELTLNKDGQVTGGSLSALVEQLTTHDCTPDPQFVSAFYMTFRLFTNPRRFAEALNKRFDYVGDSRATGTPVRLRIYNVFKGWLETYWNPEADKDALGDIRYFALHKLKPHLPSAGERLADLTRKVTAAYREGTITGPLVSGVGKASLSIASQYDSARSSPEPVVTRSQLNTLRAAVAGGPQCNILDLDPLELARQCTLITSSVFCEIQPDELLSLGWSKPGSHDKSRNVRRMCAITTDLTNVVGDTVLAPDDAKRRALVIKHWTKVAARCLELKNYDSLMAIMCSLNQSVVQRLKRTWELVPKKTKARLEELNAVVDCSKNSVSLRKRLETALAPCIPYLGIHLTDLVFLDAGNPKTRELPGSARSEDGQVISVINFDKYMRMAKVVSGLQRFQVPYKLQPVPEMQAWMKAHLQRMGAGEVEMVTHFHRRSLLIEPKQEDLKPPKTADGRHGSENKLEERPKTAAGGKERLETFLRSNTFGFKAQVGQDLPAPAAVPAKQQ